MLVSSSVYPIYIRVSNTQCFTIYIQTQDEVLEMGFRGLNSNPARASISPTAGTAAGGIGSHFPPHRAAPTPGGTSHIKMSNMNMSVLSTGGPTLTGTQSRRKKTGVNNMLSMTRTLRWTPQQAKHGTLVAGYAVQPTTAPSSLITQNQTSKNNSQERNIRKQEQREEQKFDNTTLGTSSLAAQFSLQAQLGAESINLDSESLMEQEEEGNGSDEESMHSASGSPLREEDPGSGFGSPV